MDFFACSPRLVAERNHDIPWPTASQACQTATWLLEQAHGPQQSKLNASFMQVKTLQITPQRFRAFVETVF